MVIKLTQLQHDRLQVIKGLINESPEVKVHLWQIAKVLDVEVATAARTVKSLMKAKKLKRDKRTKALMVCE